MQCISIIELKLNWVTNTGVFPRLMKAEPCPIFICVWQACTYPTRLNVTFSKINNFVGQNLSQLLERDS